MIVSHEEQRTVEVVDDVLCDRCGESCKGDVGNILGLHFDVALEIKRNVVDETFARCDLIDPKSTPCKQCGGEKFTLYGGITVCVYCASRPLDSTSSEPVADTDSEAFVRHLERATEEFRAWPDWKRGVAARLFGGSRDADSPDRRHPLLDGLAASVWTIKSRSIRDQAESIIEKLQQSLPVYTGAAHPLRLAPCEDGSFAIEWWLPSCRLAFTIERVCSESCWHFVSLDYDYNMGLRMECGPMGTADVPSLVTRALATIGVS